MLSCYYWLSPPNAEQVIRVLKPLIGTASDPRQLGSHANDTWSLRMCKNEKIICFYRHCAVRMCPQIQSFLIYLNCDQGKYHKQVLVTAEAVRQMNHTSKYDFTGIIYSNKTWGKKKWNINTIIPNKVFQMSMGIQCIFNSGCMICLLLFLTSILIYQKST